MSQRDEYLPKNSYLYWTEADHSIDNYELMVYYDVDLKNNTRFKIFEQTEIMVKDNLISCYEVEGGMLYIFDLIRYSEDVANFIEGKYSKFKETTKQDILTFYGNQDKDIIEPGKPISMTLYPNLYRRVVAEELGVLEENIVELAEKFNIKDETFEGKIVVNCQCKDDKLTYYNT